MRRKRKRKKREEREEREEREDRKEMEEMEDGRYSRSRSSVMSYKLYIKALMLITIHLSAEMLKYKKVVAYIQ